MSTPSPGAPATATVNVEGGILFILGLDALVFLTGFIIFILVRRASFTRGNKVIGSVSNESLRTRLVSRLLYRYTERKISEESKSWFGWIADTIRATPETVLETCGVDGFLYLRFQRMLIIVLGIQCAIAMPFLLGANITGTNTSTKGFGVTTANHIASGSHLFWVHTGSVIFFTILITFGVKRMLKSVTSSSSEETSAQSLLTAKIRGFPRTITDEALLQEYFDDIYPGQVAQVHICLNMNKLQVIFHKLKKINERIFHYELEYTTNGERPMMYGNRLFREICCLCLLRPRVDALSYWFRERRLIEHQAELAAWNYRTTGICFVIFKSIKAKAQFQKDFSILNLRIPRSHLSKTLRPHRWLVSSAPNAEDIRWKSLRVGIKEQIFRIVFINMVLIVGLFFFTTPLAMLAGVKEYTVDIVNNSGNNDHDFPVIKWLHSNASLLLNYIPSLLLLALTFIMPHILFFTTKFEGHHTRNAQNRAGLYKVFFYQLTAILLLPSLALTSLKTLISLNFDELTTMWRDGNLYPNGMFFIEYIIQAAFLGNFCDIWRGPEILLEKIAKLRATTLLELQEAEEVPPFKFGYEYQYFLLLFTITIFYSSVVPLMLPCGLFYLVLKHYVDKYNLIYHYPRTPVSKSKLTQTVIGFTLVALCLYQSSMVIYFYFYKNAKLEALATLICAIVSLLGLGSQNFLHFKHLDEDFLKSEEDKISAENLKDVYLHPVKKYQREHTERKASEPLLVEMEETVSEKHSLLQ